MTTFRWTGAALKAVKSIGETAQSLERWIIKERGLFLDGTNNLFFWVESGKVKVISDKPRKIKSWSKKAKKVAVDNEIDDFVAKELKGASVTLINHDIYYVNDKGTVKITRVSGKQWSV